MNGPAYVLALLAGIGEAALNEVLRHPLLYGLWIGWIVLAAIAVGQGLDRRGWPATLFAIGSISCFAVACALPRGAL
jgi:hypothetical protein